MGSKLAAFSYTLGEIASIVDGCLCGGPTVTASRVSIDSRVSMDGALFVALVGDRFDGHDFVGDALAMGAVGSLTSKDMDSDGPLVVVDDTLKALQTLASHHRGNFHGKVAAVTGSSGKTTTRTLLAKILSAKAPTHQPEKNFNNHIGVPLTLLELSDRFEMAVFELGCSDFGEIALLTGLVRPDVGVVTNVGPAHLEKLKDLDGVARAKGELFAQMTADSTVVLNLDDPRVAGMLFLAGTTVTYGRAANADVRLLSREPQGDAAQLLSISFFGETRRIRFSLPGEHNCLDAVAASAAALAMGVSANEVEAGLQTVKPVPGRLCAMEGPSGTVVIDDTYNANPASVKAALDVLVEIAPGGDTVAVLGDMLELGEFSDEAHREVGSHAVRVGVGRLITLGEGGRLMGLAAVARGLNEARWSHCDDQHHAAKIIAEILEESSALLIKGSRGMRMEQIVKLILEGSD